MYGRIVALVLLAAAVFVAVLFFVQNSLRVTQLSLNLGFAAWELQEPVSVMVIIGACLGAGFLLGAMLFGARAMRLSRRVRQLEQQVALGSDTRDW